jgi:hypothetical protein
MTVLIWIRILCIDLKTKYTFDYDHISKEIKARLKKSKVSSHCLMQYCVSKGISSGVPVVYASVNPVVASGAPVVADA